MARIENRTGWAEENGSGFCHMGTYTAFKLAVSVCVWMSVCVCIESRADFAIERGQTMQ